MDIALPLPIHGCSITSSANSASKCNSEQGELEQVEFLAIEDLLDFSDDDIGGPIQPCIGGVMSSELKIEPPIPPAFDRKLSTQPYSFESDSLCIPCDEMAELEWLSNFVEESFSSGDAPSSALTWGLPSGHGGSAGDGYGDGDSRSKGTVSIDDSFRTTSPVSVLESSSFSTQKKCFSLPSPSSSIGTSSEAPLVPGRARSKRCRTAVCFWNTRILSAELSESLLDTTSTAFNASSCQYDAFYDCEDDEDDDDEDYVRFHPNQRARSSPVKLKGYNNRVTAYAKLPNPKPKRPKMEDGAAVRKCLHCATQKTPQWRAGPMGPKTLCNACGVRYKSGRLCEEYRPAASPTFVESMHSNSHRKVLEMRRQRGTEMETSITSFHSQKRREEDMHRLRLASGAGDDVGADKTEMEMERDHIDNEDVGTVD
ncbi:hypothetical protein KP509_07G063400 [Ceratopteris richardii]|uniref:GATA transcription factor n=1 Tax=Ceratopteris richardii TaxID=49495 RepID=A0A8T2UD05_CERRI|nr:hypothetical protein KP509_07G063400 [Ceratopteris richardii]